MIRNYTLEYWNDDGWFVGKIKEIPGKTTFTPRHTAGTRTGCWSCFRTISMAEIMNETLYRVIYLLQRRMVVIYCHSGCLHEYRH